MTTRVPPNAFVTAITVSVMFLTKPVLDMIAGGCLTDGTTAAQNEAERQERLRHMRRPKVRAMLCSGRPKMRASLYPRTQAPGTRKSFQLAVPTAQASSRRHGLARKAGRIGKQTVLGLLWLAVAVARIPEDRQRYQRLK